MKKILIPFVIICIKILHNITHNKDSAKEFIGFSITWISLVIVEIFACFFGLGFLLTQF